MNEHILSLNDVCVEKDDMPILQNINLNIKRGEFLNIYGTNGAGKSTLLKLMSGLTEPSKGKVNFYDDNFVDKIFILGHKNGIKLNLTVLENLLFISDSQNLEMIKSIINEYGLTSKENVLVKYLSHGQQKRVALMRAMINEYDVWLLDEPYSGLDQDGKNILDNIIKRYIKNNGAVIVTNHKEITKDEITITNYKI